jgi:DNA-binding MarR family transcriptional regulator
MARLVAQGYVERRPDPSDGRATVHRLTAEGRELLTRLSDARDRWLEDLLADFDDDDRARFAELLDRFVRNITAAS